MISHFVDSNIIIDVISAHSPWQERSAARLEQAASDGNILINSIIYSEVSIGLETIEETEAALQIFSIVPIPHEALFLAGKVFLSYRRRGGLKRMPLPDFLIGAHAAVLDVPLLTRDAGRYRTNFPSLQLIVP